MSNIIQLRSNNDYLHGIDDNIIACKGGHHDWPHIRPGNKLPRNVKAVPQADGCYQLQETCRSCGLVRCKTTLPKGFYDRNAKYQYLDNVGYYAPRGADLSRADYSEELYRRIAEMLRTDNRKASNG
jgi:hypothetical protein